MFADQTVGDVLPAMHASINGPPTPTTVPAISSREASIQDPFHIFSNTDKGIQTRKGETSVRLVELVQLFLGVVLGFVGHFYVCRCIVVRYP